MRFKSQLVLLSVPLRSGTHHVLQRHPRQEALWYPQGCLEVVKGESGAHTQHGQTQGPYRQLALEGIKKYCAG
jgi:hypothetical protein